MPVGAVEQKIAILICRWYRNFFERGLKEYIGRIGRIPLMRCLNSSYLLGNIDWVSLLVRVDGTWILDI